MNTLTACVRASVYTTGRVIDAETQQYIPDAILIAEWEEDSFNEQYCVHTKTTKSNESGRYHLAPWIKPISPLMWGMSYPDITAYKKGYRDYVELYFDVYMIPFRGTDTERIEYLGEMSWRAGCYNRDESDLYPVWEAMYTEALGLAGTLQDYEIVNRMLSSLEEDVYGIEDSESYKRRHYREQQLKAILSSGRDCVEYYEHPDGKEPGIPEDHDDAAPMTGDYPVMTTDTTEPERRCKRQAAVTDRQRDEIKRLFTPNTPLPD